LIILEAEGYVRQPDARRSAQGADETSRPAPIRCLALLTHQGMEDATFVLRAAPWTPARWKARPPNERLRSDSFYWTAGVSRCKMRLAISDGVPGCP
jgi:hypothetical protein